MCDLYGIALAALGMLATLSCGLTIDGFGPISDNAGGIADAWREKLWMFPTSFRTVSWFHTLTHTHIAGRYFDLNSWPKSCKELKSWRVLGASCCWKLVFSHSEFPGPWISLSFRYTFRLGDGLVQSRSAPPHRCLGCCGKHHSSHRKGLCHRLCSLGLFGLVALASDLEWLDEIWEKIGTFLVNPQKNLQGGSFDFMNLRDLRIFFRQIEKHPSQPLLAVASFCWRQGMVLSWSVCEWRPAWTSWNPPPLRCFNY